MEPTPPSPAAHVLTVNNGSGSGSYEEGDVVTVSADAPPAGKRFDIWDGDWPILSSRLSATTTATMLNRDLTITATYADLPKYALTVVNGTGGGSYLEGTEVSITANTAPAGQQFANWSGSVQPGNPLSSTTTVTMPSSDAEITANYSPLPTYPLTVINGTGSGNYPAEREVTVTADPAPAGQQFEAWTGDVIFDDPTSLTTTVTMPSYAATVTATYRVSDEIRYYPRSGFTKRMLWGVFEGANGEDPHKATYYTIYTIQATPPLAWTTINADLKNYQYLRYRGPNGSYGNVAEIEFYRGGVKIMGKGYGTPGSWKNRGATFEKALDASISTYFDGPTRDGNYVGIDKGTQ